MCSTTASLLTLISLCTVDAVREKTGTSVSDSRQPVDTVATAPVLPDLQLSKDAVALSGPAPVAVIQEEPSIERQQGGRRASQNRVFVRPGADPRSERSRIAESESSYSMASASAFRVGLALEPGITLFVSGRAVGGNNRAASHGVPDIDAAASLPHGAMIGAGIGFP